MTTTKTVRFLCYAGALPFLAGAVLIWFDEPVNPFFVLQAFNVYSVMMLSFLCGTWWGFAFTGTGTGAAPAPLLLGGAGLFLALWLVMLLVPGRHLLAVLGAAYFVLLLPELRLHLPVDRAYRRLRIILTAVAVLSHLSVFLNISGILSTY